MGTIMDRINTLDGRMLIAVDLDGTLCVEGEEWRRYSEAEPILVAIEKVNRLHTIGHTIVIYTARFLEDELVTKQWLGKHAVKYHKIVFGKIRADLYIDNRSSRMEEVNL